MVIHKMLWGICSTNANTIAAQVPRRVAREVNETAQVKFMCHKEGVSNLKDDVAIVKKEE